MDKKKILGGISVIIIIVLVSIAFVGFQEETIKYRSTEDVIPKTKQGTVTFNFTISTNKSANKTRLWVPYIVSNEKLLKTGFKFKYSLENGIAELIRGYKAFKDYRFKNY